jgi:D-tagatose-1,6-bisphosphate aldolase subunit GatZ/KbaZ
VRYYWQRPEIAVAVDRLVANLAQVTIPESMLSRYLPAQYLRVRMGEISGEPVALIVDKVRDVLRMYAAACERR